MTAASAGRVSDKLGAAQATSFADLRETLLTNVIPMLQEYFYGSWDRVCAALGCPYAEGTPARTELVENGRYRSAFIDAVAVSERDLLGFDHIDYEDALEFEVSKSWLDDASPERLQRMCLDALSGAFRQKYDDRAYFS